MLLPLEFSGTQPSFFCTQPMIHICAMRLGGSLFETLPISFGRFVIRTMVL
jgi:hypothetical protein